MCNFSDHFFTYLYRNGVLIHYDGMGVQRAAENDEMKTLLFDFANPSIFTNEYDNFKIHEIIYLKTFKNSM